MGFYIESEKWVVSCFDQLAELNLFSASSVKKFISRHVSPLCYTILTVSVSEPTRFFFLLLNNKNVNTVLNLVHMTRFWNNFHQVRSN